MSPVKVLVMSWDAAASSSDSEVNTTTNRIPAFWNLCSEAGKQVGGRKRTEVIGHYLHSVR